MHQTINYKITLFACNKTSEKGNVFCILAPLGLNCTAVSLTTASLKSTSDQRRCRRAAGGITAASQTHFAVQTRVVLSPTVVSQEHYAKETG